MAKDKVQTQTCRITGCECHAVMRYNMGHTTDSALYCKAHSLEQMQKLVSHLMHECDHKKVTLTFNISGFGMMSGAPIRGSYIK